MSFRSRVLCVFAFVFAAVAWTPSTLQSQTPLDPGTPPFATLMSSPYDQINLASGGLAFKFPIRSKGGPFPYTATLNVDTSMRQGVYPVGWLPGDLGVFSTWTNLAIGGPYSTLEISYTTTNITCINNGQETYSVFSGLYIKDASGAGHLIAGNNAFYYNPCNGQSSGVVGTTYYTADGSGYSLLLTSLSAGSFTAQLYDGSGNTGASSQQGNSTYSSVASPNGVTLVNTASTSNNTQSGPYSRNVSVTDAYGQIVTNTQNNYIYSPPDYFTPTTDVMSYTDSTGETQSATLTYSSYTVQTNFGCDPSLHIAEYGPYTNVLPSSLSLPNGRAYTFTYEPTVGYPSSITGRISSIGLPNGGSISYAYLGGNNGVSCSYNPIQPSVASIVPSITRTVNDGSGHQSVWTYSFPESNSHGNTPYQGTVIDPENNETVYTFNGEGYQSQVQSYQGLASSGTLLKTVITCFNGNFSNCATSQSAFANVTQTDVYTSYGNGSPSLTETIMNSLGMVAEVKQFDYYGSAYPTGTPTIDTVTTYGTWNGNACVPIGNHILSKVCEVIVKNNYALAADTRNTYDANGNLTGTQSWATGSTYVSKSFAYNPNGSLNLAADATGSTAYTAGACNGLLPTQISRGGLAISETWDCNGGVMTSTSGPNPGQTTSYSYADPLYRPTLTTNPDGGSTATCYSDVGGSTCPRSALMNEVTTTTIATPSPNQVSKIMSDGLGRTIKTISADGAYVDTTYDLVGNVVSVSNPYFSQSDTTYGVTSYTYDAIGRLLNQCQPDNGPIGAIACAPSNSYQSYSYGMVGNMYQTTFKDEAGNTWLRGSYGLGQLNLITEPSGAMTGYGYDAFGNVVSAIQNGLSGENPKFRFFAYDGLSRLITSQNPETGTICYGTWSGGSVGSGTCQSGYDGNGNLLYKTDASGAQMQYTYDALNRVILKYSPNDAQTTNSTLTYDQGPNGLGQLYSEVTPGVTGTIFTHDIMGRVNGTNWYNIASGVWQTGISVQKYDLAGNIIQLTYPDQRVVTRAWDAAGRLSSVTDATGGSAGISYLNGTQYSAAGTLLGATLSSGVAETFMMNNRLQPCRSLASTTALPAASGGGANLYDRQSFYNPSISSPCGNEANNNGNVYAIIDNLAPSNAQGFHYDGMNRLTSASNSNGTYNQTYNYDSFGNMLLQDNLHANLAYSIDPYTSRLLLNNTDFVYSPNGNLVSSPGMSYLYMPEGYLRCINNCSVGSYLTDGLGERTLAVHNNNSWNEYVYLNGQPVADLDNNGTWTDYISANGQNIAKVQNQNSIFHLTGSVVAGTGAVSTGVQFSGLNGMTIQAGDTLRLWQYTIPENGAAGGILLSFADGTYSSGSGAWTDAEGQEGNEDGVQGQWHQRTLDMSQFQGRTVSDFIALSERTGSVGQYDYYFADISVHRADGTIVPVWIGMPSPSELSGTVFGPGTATATVDNSQPAASNTAQSTHFYLNDHLGTTQIELSAGGWPIWQGAFTPFGQEIIGGSTTNYIGQQPADGTSMRYKFTGKERDAESGLDNFGARMYANVTGRWLSPDPSGLYYADPTNPQSLNLYSYVRNNPLIGTDPTGMAYCQWDDGTQDDSANTGVDGAVNSGTVCSNLGGTWSHDDGLNDDGSQMGSEGAPSLTVTATLVTSTDTTSVSTTGPSYDPDAANLYMFSVYLTADTEHSFGCIAGAYVGGGPSAASTTVGSQVFDASQNLVAKTKAAGALGGSTAYTSEAAMAARSSALANIPSLGLKSPVGTPFAGNFAMRTSPNMGVAAGRYAPYAGAAMKGAGIAGTAYSSYKLWNCLGGHS
jgi:RHS repeat-associated protein